MRDPNSALLHCAGRSGMQGADALDSVISLCHCHRRIDACLTRDDAAAFFFASSSGIRRRAAVARSWASAESF